MPHASSPTEVCLSSRLVIIILPQCVGVLPSSSWSLSHSVSRLSPIFLGYAPTVCGSCSRGYVTKPTASVPNSSTTVPPIFMSRLPRQRSLLPADVSFDSTHVLHRLKTRTWSRETPTRACGGPSLLHAQLHGANKGVIGVVSALAPS